MGTITRNCPHCHSQQMTFVSFAEFREPNSGSPIPFLTAFKCNGCHGGYFAKIKQNSGQSPHQMSGDINSVTFLKITDEYPKEKSLEAPEHLPDNIKRFFIQAAHSLGSGNLDASAMMSRKVLEVSVKTLNSVGSGSLYNRIEQLHTAGIITDDLKSWAHIIRDDGNEAAHEELPVTPDFAQELLYFCELFLMYTFTMPGMISERMGEES